MKRFSKRKPEKETWRENERNSARERCLVSDLQWWWARFGCALTAHRGQSQRRRSRKADLHGENSYGSSGAANRTHAALW